MTIRNLHANHLLHRLTLILALFLVACIPALGDVTCTEGLLSENTRWETPWYLVDSGEPGPLVCITGGVHGNEPAGYRAAEHIRHWSIARGRLLVVPRVNAPGCAENTRWLPCLDEGSRNANRNFPVADETPKPRTAPVKALWALLEARHPDWVVDLHEGFDFRIANEESDGSSVICFDTPEMQALATKIADEINADIDDPERKFVTLWKSGPIKGGLVRAAVENLGAQGVCFETTYEQQPVSTRTRQQRTMVHRLLSELGMKPSVPGTMTEAKDPGQARIAVFDAGGTGGSGVENLQRIIESDSGMTLCHVGAEDIRTGVLNQFDAVIFPGGSGSKEAAALGEAGCAAVKEFIAGGGGYAGICAGAFLATANYDWSLALTDAKTFTGNREIPGVGVKSMWYRGTGEVTLEFNEAGRSLLGAPETSIQVRYANGPILSPAGKPSLPAYTPLAFFRSEISLYPPQVGTMCDTPAIVTARYVAGRVLLNSPHLESTPDFDPLMRRGIAWVAGQTPNPAP